MTDCNALQEWIEESGYKKAFIAAKLGITRAGLAKKLSRKSEFKADEILAFTRDLNMSTDTRDKIFFAEVVER